MKYDDTLTTFAARTDTALASHWPGTQIIAVTRKASCGGRNRTFEVLGMLGYCVTGGMRCQESQKQSGE